MNIIRILLCVLAAAALTGCETWGKIWNDHPGYPYNQKKTEAAR